MLQSKLTIEIFFGFNYVFHFDGFSLFGGNYIFFKKYNRSMSVYTRCKYTQKEEPDLEKSHF